jgi:PAS domain S-box-containing protein
MQSPQDAGGFRRIVRKLAEGAQNSELAIVVGNRAGVIEWANAAWARVTGYPIEGFISKPVADFIERVDIEPGVVDLVAACFRENKVCEIDVPLRAPDGRQNWVHLRVEPLVDRAGDVTDFMAIASDISERKRAETCAGLTEVDLSALAMRMAERYHDALHPMTSYDLSLDEDVPLVLADESLLEGLVGRAICRAARALGRGWGPITQWSGVLGEGDGPL